MYKHPVAPVDDAKVDLPGCHPLVTMTALKHKIDQQTGNDMRRKNDRRRAEEKCKIVVLTGPHEGKPGVIKSYWKEQDAWKIDMDDGSALAFRREDRNTSFEVISWPERDPIELLMHPEAFDFSFEKEGCMEAGVRQGAEMVLAYIFRSEGPRRSDDHNEESDDGQMEKKAVEYHLKTTLNYDVEQIADAIKYGQLMKDQFESLYPTEASITDNEKTVVYAQRLKAFSSPTIMCNKSELLFERLKSACGLHESGDGFITIAEIDHIREMIRHYFIEQTFQQDPGTMTTVIFETSDYNRDGAVDYRDFKQFVYWTGRHKFGPKQWKSLSELLKFDPEIGMTQTRFSAFYELPGVNQIHMGIISRSSTLTRVYSRSS